MNVKTKLIDDLDLTNIVLKLRDPRGLGWSEERSNQSVKKYKNFLKLLLLYPKVGLRPTPEIDEVWHAHILHTRKYVQDCTTIFGYYLHHRPDPKGFDDDSLEKRNQFEKTYELYEQMFNEPIADLKDSRCSSSPCSGCRCGTMP